MLRLNRIHHIAIICSDYAKSKAFYTDVLGFTIVNETYRAGRQSYKLDLALHGEMMLELFSFPETPARLSQPEATGLRHIAFEVDDIHIAVAGLKSMGIAVEEIRVDELTGKQFTFLQDPDKLPIELYAI